MKKLLNDNKIIITLLSVFMVIQPFLDINFLFEDPKLSIFGLTIPTIVRTSFILAVGFIMFIKNKDNKEKKHIFIYFTFLFIYSLIHHEIASSNMNIPNTFKYSIISEAFYVLRMLLPLMIIYITKNSKIKYDNYINVILYSSIIIGIVIIISNTFLILYTSYESDTLTVKASWIDWIFGDISKYKFEELTSKGWFYMANQVSGLMILLLPQCIMDILKKIKISNIIATISLTFAMIILGTRTSAYGWLLVYVSVIAAVFILYKLKYIKKINYKPIIVVSIIFVVFASMLFIAPIKQRKYTKDLKPTIAPQLTEYDDVYEYIEKYYTYYGIPDVYIKELYPYRYDYKFWFIGNFFILFIY